MNGNKVGQWVHPAFAATSMAFFLTIFDKEELVASSPFLIFCVNFYALSLLLNSVWSFIYYTGDSKIDINNKLRSNIVFKGLDNLSYWSFIFPTISFILYILTRTYGAFK